jgi:hypothetical protein
MMMQKMTALTNHSHGHLDLQITLVEVKLRKKLRTQEGSIDRTTQIEMETNLEVEVGATEAEVEEIGDEVEEEGSTIVGATTVGIHYHLKVIRMATIHSQAGISHNRQYPTLKEDTHNHYKVQPILAIRRQMSTHPNNPYCGHNSHHRTPINNRISKLCKIHQVAGRICLPLPLYHPGHL